MCGLPGAQFGDSQTPVTYTPYLGDAWPNAQSSDIHKAGSQERLPPYQDQRRSRIKDCIPAPLRPVRIPSHSLRINERASHIPGLHWRLPTALHWPLCHMLPRRHTDLFDQWEGSRRPRTNSARAATPIRPLLQSRKVPIWSLKNPFPRIYHQLWRSRHGIRPHINHRGLAYSEVNSRGTSAPRLHKLLPTVHPQIRQGNDTNLRLTKEFARQMGMDPSGRRCISEAQEGIHRSTDPPALRSGKAYHPPDGRMRLRNRQYSQSIRQFRYSQTGQLLLAKMLSCRTELRHVRSGAYSHRGDLETMATLSRGSQSQHPDKMRPQESRVLPNVESALPDASEMGWDPFIIRLRYSTPGREKEPCRRTIKTTWLRRRLRKTYCTTLGNSGGNHC